MRGGMGSIWGSRASRCRWCREGNAGMVTVCSNPECPHGELTEADFWPGYRRCRHCRNAQRRERYRRDRKDVCSLRVLYYRQNAERIKAAALENYLIMRTDPEKWRAYLDRQRDRRREERENVCPLNCTGPRPIRLKGGVYVCRECAAIGRGGG